MIKNLFLIICLSIWSIASQASFIGRLPATPGGTNYQAYYDTQLNITWLANSNAAVGSSYDTYSPGYGYMTWQDANAWTASLNIAGVTGWRLPNMDVNSDGTIVHCGFSTQAVTQVECMDNEYGHFSDFGAGTTFGNGVTPSNPGPFSNLEEATYWSGNESDADPLDAWHVLFRDDFNQGTVPKSFQDRAWAVHDGDIGAIGAVPIPATVWLFGSGLLGLIGLARRKSK